MNITELDTLHKIATCLPKTIITKSDLKGRHKYGIKKKLSTISSTEQELLKLGHTLTEQMNFKDVCVCADLPSDEERMKIYNDSD